jgi:hypothetical protein
VTEFSRLGARLCATVLFALLALELHWRGRLHFELPTTVVSNDYFPLRASEPYLLFLQEVARRVLRGTGSSFWSVRIRCRDFGRLLMTPLLCCFLASAAAHRGSAATDLVPPLA